MTCVYKEYEVKIKVVQEQWLGGMSKFAAKGGGSPLHFPNSKNSAHLKQKENNHYISINYSPSLDISLKSL